MNEGAQYAVAVLRQTSYNTNNKISTKVTEVVCGIFIVQLVAR